MNEKHLAQFETHLERLVEGVFAGLFRRQLNVHDIATKLARGMETNLRTAQGDDPRPLAPDKYTLTVHPDVQKRLQEHQPNLSALLAQHLVELAAQAGYRLLHPPVLFILANRVLAPSDVVVQVEHSQDVVLGTGTAAMSPVKLDPTTPRHSHPQLVINGGRIIAIDKPVINIGRGEQNDIVIDDPYISRHHLQLRWRAGAYLLFDTQSKAGTRVNNVPITEHRLQPGDVIRIGNTQLIYMVDEPPEQPQLFSTDIFNPVDPE